MITQELINYLNNYLYIHLYNDYGPNGLQIEGQKEVKKIAFAVSATRESIEKSVEESVHMLIVHHGLFWKFHGVRTITKAFAKRVKPLIQNDINLLGYHLPLDAHPEVGNAKALADRLGLKELEKFGDYKGMPTGMWGHLKSPMNPIELQGHIAKVCHHNVLMSSPDKNKKIKTLGIITGGANSDWTYAEKLNLDAYLTGEMSEHDWHEAKESNIVMYAAGHHASEKFGIQLLKNHIEQKFNLECLFFDSENPA